MVDSELNASELGTKEYWQKFYDLERQNFEQHGDTGEIWFGKNNQKRIVEYLCQIYTNQDHRKIVRILDIGSGNGALLLELVKHGFTSLFGIDFATEAISLARSIAMEAQANVVYQVADILNSESVAGLNKYDVILDKGTYDAISLTANSSEARRIYKNSVKYLLNPQSKNTKFILTSCNWTKGELKEFFTPDCSMRLTYPRFHWIIGQSPQKWAWRICVGSAYFYYARRFFSFFEIDGYSMYPLLNDGQIVFATTVFYANKIKRGDLIVCRDPVVPEDFLIKRVIALEFDTVSGVEIKRGHVWLEGDNKENSRDSRERGQIPLGLVTNQVKAVVIS